MKSKPFTNYLTIAVVLAVIFSANNALAQQIQDDGPLLIRPFPELVGFATLKGGVTGGAGGTEVTVTTGEELLRFATSNDPYIINVVDTIEIVKGIGNYTESAGEYRLGSNTTIRGIGPNATIMFGGFRIDEVENIIIQNLTFDGAYRGYRSDLENIPCSSVPEGWHRYKNGPCLQPGDRAPTDNALEIGQGSERIWITQNTFKRYSDEIMSIKREASYVTLSWNRYDDPVAGKNGMMILIGHSDNHLPDIGRLKTTIHHNFFGARDRQPRIRFGQVHILNNYYANPHGIFNYGAAAQRDSEVAIEGNYYDSVGNRPWRFDINNQFGFVDQRNNVLVNTTQAQTRGTFGSEVFEPNDVYDFTVDNPNDIPDIVMSSVGAGNWDTTVGERPVPGIAYSISPAFSSTVDRRPEFEWTPAILATSYQLQVAESAAFEEGEIVVDVTVTETSYYQETQLAANSGFFWRVRAINDRGPSAWTQPAIFFTNNSVSIASGSDFPQTFELTGNYPNPFNPRTNIQFGLPEVASIDLRVYDALGRQVAVLVNQEQYQPGYHTVIFDAARLNLSSGVYVYRIVANPVNGGSSERFVQTKSMMLIK